ncbi:MAG: Hpt domain-containing protein [Methylococcales bacterium]|nr:Hpt domain-containing protein [Methylococcales bacterium]
MKGEFVYIDAMLKRTIGNKKLAIRLFEKLFTEIPLEIDELQRAINANEIILAQKILHKLQGSFSFCGFLTLSVLSKQLEDTLFAKNLKKNKIFFELLKKETTNFNELKGDILEKLI